MHATFPNRCPGSESAVRIRVFCLHLIAFAFYASFTHLRAQARSSIPCAHASISSARRIFRTAMLSLSRQLSRRARSLQSSFANAMNMSSDVKVDAYTVGSASNIKFHEGMVERETKEKLLKQKGVVLWFTGLSGSGKSTVACTLEHALAARGHMTVLLDGDNVRHGLNSNLGFTAEDREENIRRIGEVSKLFAESGILTLTSFISPYRADRYACVILSAGRFASLL